MQTEQPAKPRRRRWRIWLALLLVCAGGWGAYRLLNPTLRPVTRRLLPEGTQFRFSANGVGYPAIESRVIAGGIMSAVWLDARSQPAPGLGVSYFNCCVSPSGTVAGTFDYAGLDTYRITSIRRDGRREHCRMTLANHGYFDRLVTDLGSCCNAFDDIIKSDGAHRMIVRPYWDITNQIACADPRYLACYTTSIPDRVANRKLMIYNIALPTPELVASLPVPRLDQGCPVMVFSHGKRFLVVPAYDAAYVCEEGKIVRTLGNTRTRWGWGDDGTVWGDSVDGHTCLLHWQTGIIDIVPLPVMVPPESQFYDMTGSVSLLDSAVWGDGRMIAVTQTRQRTSINTISILNKILHRVSKAKSFPREARALTLYRDGAKVGTFAVWLTPKGPVVPFTFGTMTIRGSSLYPSIVYREHLAFSKDGRYLSWIVDVGRGPQVYVFETGLKP